ncbi:uncharacterized protein LOC126856414 isoform X1 [Cataglyphis hispanica]|uniref:uncharacterized protein LOC126856414 isoform X1 n=1 Tax=Cataglyphis hispanica TaxID=1086592 RepID=UPI0021806705|nr:uncharacterized protein LOC126856414 isoform X1 [Cataglyphis hispanica]
MLSRVNLVAILLILNCVSRAMEYSRSLRENRQDEEERAVTSSRRILRYTYNNVTSESPIFSTDDRVARDTLAEMHVQDVHSAQSRSEVEARVSDEARRRRRMNIMLPLLLAYKLKFISLIPTIIGGLFLLKGTTLLAGFFFALFAAVLGLKVH